MPDHNETKQTPDTPAHSRAATVEQLTVVKLKCSDIGGDSRYDYNDSKGRNVADTLTQQSIDLGNTIDLLTDDAFEKNTQEFKALVKDIEVSCDDATAKLERLEKIVHNIELATEILDVVDKVVATAAAVAGTG